MVGPGGTSSSVALDSSSCPQWDRGAIRNRARLFSLPGSDGTRARRGAPQVRCILGVYKNASDLSITDRRYVELAEHASESLANARRNPTSAAAIQLEATIHSAEKTMPKAQLAVFYRSLVELYSDKPWAKDVITRIKARQAD